jgi:hypothetical protein
MSFIDDPLELDALQLEFRDKILIELSGGAGITRENADECTDPPPNTTLTGFFNKVKEVVDATQINADQRVLVTETMPENNIFQDPDDQDKELSGMILTTVLRREPGTLAGGNQPFRAKRQDVRPKIIRRVVKKDPNKPGVTTFIISKWFDNLVGLNIAARTNKRANELAEWFENLMEFNRPLFELDGFQKVMFKGRMSDLRRDDSVMKISFRPLKYYLRTETFFTITEQQLNRLIVQVTAGTS